MDWLSQRAHRTPSAPALFFGEQRWDYRALRRQALGFARGLWRLGLRPSGHVGMLLPNCPETVFLVHAAAMLGLALVPLNVRLTISELQDMLVRADVEVLIYDQESTLEFSRLSAPGLEMVSVQSLYAEAEDFSLPPFDLNNTQGLLYTSGTSGQPKGALLTYANHFWSATASAFHLGVQTDDRWLLSMPLNHVGGLAILFRSVLYGTAVDLYPSFDPEKTMVAMETNTISLISLVPTMLQRLLEHYPKRKAPPGLRAVLLGGASASAELLQRAYAQGWPLAVTYGLTEAASQVSTSLPGKPEAGEDAVGRPLMFTTLRVANEEGKDLPAGEMGEILVSGPTVMCGYYQQPEATASVLRGGWLHTGDIGALSSEGVLSVYQRRSDLILSGGENIYPAEVESALSKHPAVAEACVVGLADDAWGQRVAAGIVLEVKQTISEAEAQAFCRQFLGGYKIPREIYFLPALPRTVSGKIQRAVLREMLTALSAERILSK